MKQIFHIFRKDVRHHWIAIVLCQAALLLYCWDEVSSWSERAEFGVSAFSGLIRLLPALTWCFFVFRVVQDESLVGDRQFWVTRPYEWKKLLAEKILLVVVFLNLPMLIAGIFLLAKAGFSPAPHLLGLVWMQAFLFLFPLLPLLALASVTRSLGPALVTLLAVLMFLVGIAVVPLFFRHGGLFAVAYGFGISLPAPRGSDGLDLLLIALACTVATVLQYARRKTFQSRLWLAGALLATLAISMISAYARDNRDPLPVPARPTIPFHAGLDPIKLSPPKTPVAQSESVAIAIPIKTWGLPSNTVGEIRGIRVVLEGPGGLRWHENQAGAQLLGPDENYLRPYYSMEPETYESMKGVPLRAHLSLSVDVFREDDHETIAATSGEFAVPGLGRCRIWGRDGHGLRCNSPMAKPVMVIARVDPASSTCPAEDVGPQKPAYGFPYAWQRGRDFAAEGGITPVVPSYFSFWYFNDRANICPGTPISFSFPQFVENVRSDFTVDDFQLDNYRQLFSANGITAADGTRLGLPAPPR